jgi:hypothetical protein
MRAKIALRLRQNALKDQVFTKNLFVAKKPHRRTIMLVGGGKSMIASFLILPMGLHRVGIRT